MKKATRLLALILCLVMAMSLVACGGSAAPAETKAPAEENKTTEAAPEAPAKEEPVELVWYVANGAGPQADTQQVLDEVNKYLLEKINCTLKMVETDFGNYTQKMQMVIASQEEFDICWTANWSNNFYTNVSKNAFLELDELVATYAPELMEAMPANGWEACKVGGKLYAIPSQQIWAMTNIIHVREDLLEKYNFDMSNVTKLADMEEFLAAFKAENPDKYPLWTTNKNTLGYNAFSIGYDELAGRDIPGVILLEGEDLTVYNQWKLPEVREFIDMIYDWAQKGYIRPDAATVADDSQGLLAGNYAMGFGGTYKPGGEVGESTKWGTPMTMNKISKSWQPTSGITATMNAVSRTSKHPEKAVEFLNLLNTDPYLFNLIAHGIEGEHYEKLDGNYFKPNTDAGYYPNADWMFGNQFLSYLAEGQGENDWADTLKLNNEAVPSPALGFVFDPVPVQDQMATVSAVLGEYANALGTGALDPAEHYDEFLEKLDQAGAQEIVDEVQRQLDAWAAAK